MLSAPIDTTCSDVVVAHAMAAKLVWELQSIEQFA